MIYLLSKSETIQIQVGIATFDLREKQPVEQSAEIPNVSFNFVNLNRV